MTTVDIIISVLGCTIAHVLVIISGYAKMICDLSEEEKLSKEPFTYWHKRLSSNNKNMYTGKIKLWLMRNLFVMLTDGWHKYQFILTVCLIASGFILGYTSGRVNPLYTLFLLSLYFTRTLTFHLLYNSKKYRL